MPHVDERRYPHVVAALERGDMHLLREYGQRGSQTVSRIWREKRAKLLASAIARGDERLANRIRRREAAIAKRERQREEADAWREHDAEQAARDRQQRIADWYAANYHIIPPPSACGD